MANTDLVKNQIMALVAEGRADEAWEYAETIREHLTLDELKDMEMWIAQNAYEAFLPSEQDAPKKTQWLEIAGYMKKGETLRDVFSRLPRELQDFLQQEGRLAKGSKQH
jgi:hypothetical protein